MYLAIYEGPIDLDLGLLISLIAIILVFVVLLIIIGSVKLLQIFCKVDKENVEKSTSSKNKISEIKDEDMMIAALIATIDYANETKKDVRLVSIKQIG